jgi:hypothetical protein
MPILSAALSALAALAALRLPLFGGAPQSSTSRAAGIAAAALLTLLFAPLLPLPAAALAACAIGVCVATDLGSRYLYLPPLALLIALGLLLRLAEALGGGGAVGDEVGTAAAVAIPLLLYLAGRLFGRLRDVPLDPDTNAPYEPYGLFDALLTIGVALVLPGPFAVGAVFLAQVTASLGAVVAWAACAALRRPSPVGLPQAPFVALGAALVCLPLAIAG